MKYAGLAGLVLCGAVRLGAQTTPESALVRHIDGHVNRAVPGGLRPLPGAIVTLHRVGSDIAGPLDSMRTRSDGGFSFRFRPSGARDAVYFVSVTYAGIASFSTPATADAQADDADITVFDTTSAPVPIRVAGRHVVITAPRDGTGPREVEEVFELSNDSSVTRVSPSDSVPVWVTSAPPGATNVRAAATPDIAPAAITIRGSRVELFAPLSPGIRQFAFTYAVPDDAFPLAIGVARPTTVLEVLIEEPGARITGAKLEEVAPVPANGRTFRRFLGQDVPADAALRVELPASGVDARSRFVLWIALALAAAMLAALIVALRRRRAPIRAPIVLAESAQQPAAAASSRTLLRDLAMLDAQFESLAAPTDAERARYESQRAELKARVARVLAEERRLG